MIFEPFPHQEELRQRRLGSWRALKHMRVIMIALFVGIATSMQMSSVIGVGVIAVAATLLLAVSYADAKNDRRIIELMELQAAHVEAQVARMKRKLSELEEK